MREFYLEPINKKKFDPMKLDLMIIEDFKKYFDWMSIGGFDPDFSVGFWSVRNIYMDEKFDMQIGRGFSMSHTIAYTLLKGVGCDVSRYGLKEVYLSVDENQKLIRE